MLLKEKLIIRISTWCSISCNWIYSRITVWEAYSLCMAQHWFLIGLTVSISLVGVVLWGTLSGSMLPFIIEKD